MEPFEPIGFTDVHYDSATLMYLSIAVFYFYFLHCMLKRRERARLDDGYQAEKIDSVSV